MENKGDRQFADIIRGAADVSGEAVLPSSIELNDNLSPEILEVMCKARLDIINLFSQVKSGMITENDPKIIKAKKMLALLNSLDVYVQSRQDPEAGFGMLRGKQTEVFEQLRKYFEKGGKEGYFKLPTGFGKTVLFLKLVEATNAKILILVPTQILVNQTMDKLRQFAPKADAGKVYAYAKEFEKNVTVMTYDSFLIALRNETINPDEFEVLVLDEAHKSLSDRRIEAIKGFDNAVKLGFTATPTYSETKSLKNLLLPDEIYSMGIAEAVHEELLCPLRVILARTTVDLSGVDIKSDGEFVEEKLSKAVNVASRNNPAIDLYKKYFSGKQGVAFCVGVKHAQDLAGLFEKAGVKAACVYGDQNPTERKKNLDSYDSGDIKVLCNADLLIEGFDAPAAGVCLNLRPTRSIVVAEQRGGRVLRLDPNNLGKYAVIVEFIDKNAIKPQKLFSEIVGAAEVPPGDKLDQYGKQRNIQYDRIPNEIIIDGLEVIVDTEEVARITREEFTEVEKVPDEWIKQTDFVKELHERGKKLKLTLKEVESFIDLMSLADPEVIKEFKNDHGQIMTFVSPEFAAVCRMIISGLFFQSGFHYGYLFWTRSDVELLDRKKVFYLISGIFNKYAFALDKPALDRASEEERMFNFNTEAWVGLLSDNQEVKQSLRHLKRICSSKNLDEPHAHIGYWFDYIQYCDEEILNLFLAEMLVKPLYKRFAEAVANSKVKRDESHRAVRKEGDDTVVIERVGTTVVRRRRQ